MFKKRFGVTDIVVGESGDIYFVEDEQQDDELERIREEQRLKEKDRKNKIEAERLAEQRRLRRLYVENKRNDEERKRMRELSIERSLLQPAFKSDENEVVLPISIVFVDPTEEFGKLYEIPSTSDLPTLQQNSDNSNHPVSIKKEMKSDSSASYSDFNDNESTSEDEKVSIKNHRISLKSPQVSIKQLKKQDLRKYQSASVNLQVNSTTSASNSATTYYADILKGLKKPRMGRGNKVCIYCDEEFKSAQARRDHKCKYLDCQDGFYICRICGKTLSKNGYAGHVHGMPPCKFCGRNILNPRRMILHIRKRHWKEKDSEFSRPFTNLMQASYECDYCGMILKQKIQFTSHLYTHLPPEAFICSTCGVDCKNRRNFLIHRKNRHKNVRAFKCELCDKSYNQKNGMLLHQWNEHGYGECEVCGQFVKSKDEMVTHMATHGNFECERCQKSFLTPRRLKHHMDRHVRMDENGGVDPNSRHTFTCSLCNIKFTDRVTFDHHMRTHGSITQFPCEICGKICTSKASLSAHQQNKHDIGVKCEICKSQVPSKEHLKEHMKIHGNFDCDVCKKSFVGPTKLNQHLRLHVNFDEAKNRVDCNFCDKSFMERRLRAHVFKFHPEEFKNWEEGGAKTFVGPSKRNFRKTNKEIESACQKINCDFCVKLFKPRFLRAHVKKYHVEKFDRWCDEFFKARSENC